MKIVTIGLGYIGLPTSLIFAKHGMDVLGVDISKDIVEQLNAGIVSIEEPGLEILLSEVLAKNKFKASLTFEEGDVFIVAVPTPNNSDRFGSCDLSYINQALNGMLPYVQSGNTIIVESTVAPRTMEDVVQPFFEKAGFKVGEDIFLVHCPERVLPGQILHELVYNNRIIGGITEKCTKKGQEIYGTFVKGNLLGAKASTAELSKLMENTYRDVNIALANELVQIGERLNIDSLEVIDLANQHPRVNIHQPGPGVGGHCLAVDPYFVVASAPEETKLIQTARQINSQMPNFIVQKVQEIMKKNNGKIITVLGLAYKGNIGDIRESPAIQIVNQLEKLSNYEIRTYDPHVKQVEMKTLTESLHKSDLALILCDHDEFKKLSPEVRSMMNNSILFDTKNCYTNYADFKTYYTLGTISTEID
ncbi:nucleotide sugar dehydrogenase [Vagococcus sp.]|uniref:nucleotide sugar dehydrogenase n=1 Tax=Vagococcus sp. TaxID=1933889 RepID=UPI002FC83B42